MDIYKIIIKIINNMTENSEFLVDLINNYIKYYKYTNNITNNLFDDFDDKQLKLFWNEMKKYKQDNGEIYQYNNETTKIYNYGIYEDNKLILVSDSLFALLLEITNLEYESKYESNSNSNRKYQLKNII